MLYFFISKQPDIGCSRATCHCFAYRCSFFKPLDMGWVKLNFMELDMSRIGHLTERHDPFLGDTVQDVLSLFDAGCGIASCYISIDPHRFPSFCGKPHFSTFLFCCMLKLSLHGRSSVWQMPSPKGVEGWASFFLNLGVPSGNLTVCYGKLPIYSGFTHKKWGFYIVTLVYQKVNVYRTMWKTPRFRFGTWSAFMVGFPHLGVTGLQEAIVSFQSVYLMIIFAVKNLPFRPRKIIISLYWNIYRGFLK